MKIFALLILNSVLFIKTSSGLISSFEPSATDINTNIEKKSISFGLVLSHYNNPKKDNAGNFKNSLLDLGGETLIHFHFRKDIDLATGLHYQSGKMTESFLNDKITFGELSIPFLINTPFPFLKNNTKYKLKTGLYAGQLIHTRMQRKGGKLYPDNEWHDISLEYFEGYSPNHFIADYYIGVDYRDLKNGKDIFEFSLFAKYRINELWLNQIVSKLVIGAKINFYIKL